MSATAERAARPLAMAVAALGVGLLIGAVVSVTVRPDAEAYWLAAQRLREGLPLYGGPRGDETEIYRYAPWLAFAWVPLTYLGHDSAFLVWRGLLLIATLAAIAPLIRRPTPASVTLAVLLGGLLVSALPAANATPLVVGALALGLQTRFGPILLGLAGSLKVFPLLLVAGYVAERRWLHAAVAIGVAAVLWLQILAFDVGLYADLGGPSFYVGGMSLLSVTPLLWLPVAIACLIAVAVLAIRRSPWTWLAAAAAIPLAVPRIWIPDAAYLLPGAATLLRVIDRGQRLRAGNRP
ncbi:MAG: hypothetical protein ABI578_07285 [Chloroflexota bacterium]